jgi:hypothetical protein
VFYIDVQTNRLCGSPFYLHSDGWALQRYSSNQPQPTMQCSINMALPTVGVDWLDATGMVVVVAAAGAANSRRIHSREQRANVRITCPRCTSTLKTETTATLIVVMLTTGTPA